METVVKRPKKQFTQRNRNTSFLTTSTPSSFLSNLIRTFITLSRNKRKVISSNLGINGQIWSSTKIPASLQDSITQNQINSLKTIRFYKQIINTAQRQHKSYSLKNNPKSMEGAPNQGTKHRHPESILQNHYKSLQYQ